MDRLAVCWLDRLRNFSDDLDGLGYGVTDHHGGANEQPAGLRDCVVRQAGAVRPRGAAFQRLGQLASPLTTTEKGSSFLRPPFSSTQKQTP